MLIQYKYSRLRKTFISLKTLTTCLQHAVILKIGLEGSAPFPPETELLNAQDQLQKEAEEDQFSMLVSGLCFLDPKSSGPKAQFSAPCTHTKAVAVIACEHVAVQYSREWVVYPGFWLRRCCEEHAERSSHGQPLLVYSGHRFQNVYVACKEILVTTNRAILHSIQQ